MKFVDPSEIKCTKCKRSDFYSVNSLLSLKATCSYCSNLLELQGRNMRKMIDEWRAFLGKVELALSIEEQYGVNVSDNILEQSTCIKDLVNNVNSKATLSLISINSVIALVTKYIDNPDIEVSSNSEFISIFSKYA